MKTARTTAGSRPVLWLALAVLATLALAVAALDAPLEQTDAERIQRLTNSFACPECDGQSVSESNASVAAAIEDLIRIEVASGSTDNEIRDRLVLNYGTDVLLTPPSDGFSSLIWILPVLVLVFGGAGVAQSIRRSGAGSREATDADVALVEQARRGRDVDDD